MAYNNLQEAVTTILTNVLEQATMEDIHPDDTMTKLCLDSLSIVKCLGEFDFKFIDFYENELVYADSSSQLALDSQTRQKILDEIHPKMEDKLETSNCWTKGVENFVKQNTTVGKFCELVCTFLQTAELKPRTDYQAGVQVADGKITADVPKSKGAFSSP